MIAIGEASKRSGVGIETIRYYEREGVVPAPERARNNRRLYSAEDVGRLRLVKRLRDLGFPLAEVRLLLAMSESRVADCSAVKEHAENHIAFIETRIAELRRVENSLRQLVSNCEQGNVECPMLQKLRSD
jgi:MerR family mercuric resistance operon transcriptional regulator